MQKLGAGLQIHSLSEKELTAAFKKGSESSRAPIPVSYSASLTFLRISYSLGPRDEGEGRGDRQEDSRGEWPSSGFGLHVSN